MSLDPSTFLAGLGLPWAVAFVLLTALVLHQALAVRDLSQSAIQRCGAGASHTPTDAENTWRELAGLKGHIEAGVTRAGLLLGGIPTLALLGTCYGFFVALARVGELDLAGQDPLALLETLMDGGIATALATTVCGQALYLVLGQAWALAVAGPVAEANVRLDEVLALLRERLPAGGAR